MIPSVGDILDSDGLIADSLANYEHREEQMEMAEAVANAFEDRKHLLVEAGTGVGKSFAYLVPAILRATENEQRVVISTYTIALQEQLIGKDLPFLAKVLPVKFSAVLGKGRGNYLCFRRMQMTVKNREQLLASDFQDQQLSDLADWAMDTSNGELQEIDFEMDNSVWNRVRSEPGVCRGSRCSFYSRCHLQAARQRLLSADIVVVNHALFFSDLALKRGGAGMLLGEYDLAVIDEAHTVETVAADHFGLSVSSAGVSYLLRDLYNGHTNRGMLAMVGAHDAIDAVNRTEAAADEFFKSLSLYEGEEIRRNGRIVSEHVVPNTLTAELQGLASHLKDLRKQTENEDQQFEYLGYEMRAMEFASAVDSLIAQTDAEQAYWTTSSKGRQKTFVTLSSAPINVAPILSGLLFDEIGSVILTSATLSTQRGGEHGFDYMRGRLGVTQAEELLLSSPFDFHQQAKLYIESRMPAPNQLADFAPAAAGAIRHYVNKSEGRCFVLTTSYSMLRALADELEDFCDSHDFRLLVQGAGLQRTTMLEKFRAEPRSILLGTASFWQGVDVAGAALSNVIITKLPFAAPDTPIIEARIDALREAGANPFFDFQVPEAVILFKQGFGRLIRSKTDTGFVVVLDPRVVTKSYGRSFLQALPDMEIIRDEFTNEEAWM